MSIRDAAVRDVRPRVYVPRISFDGRPPLLFGRLRRQDTETETLVSKLWTDHADREPAGVFGGMQLLASEAANAEASPLSNLPAGVFSNANNSLEILLQAMSPCRTRTATELPHGQLRTLRQGVSS